jgi:hypothetical protein
VRHYSCPHYTSEIHFENTVCGKCHNSLGYVVADDTFQVTGAGQANDRHICAIHDLIGCNWLIEAADASRLCTSCRHTLVIPDLALTQSVDHWARLKRAKRMLFYALHMFHLPLPDQQSIRQQPGAAPPANQRATT